MKNKLIALVMVFVMILSMSAFAYNWQEVDGNWYMYNDEGNRITNSMIDTGENVFYFDGSGRLVTGWWKNSHTNKIYFFNNKKGKGEGGMIFGLHQIDGYKHYFGDDGSLQTSSTKGTFKQVYQDYYADYYGYLYVNNQLVRDESIAKSEYYTNTLYYYSDDLNNYYLATGDTVTDLNVIVKLRDQPSSNDSSMERKVTDYHVGYGGLNYYVDENNIIHTYGDVYETKPAEKYGPMITN